MLVLEAVAYMVRHSEAGFAAFFVKMSQFAIYEASFVMGIMYYYYLKASLPYVKENEKLLKISSYILYTVLYIGAFMEIVNLFAGSMYSFDASNRIQRGTLFFIYPLVIALANLIDFVVLLRYKEEITRRKFWVLSSYVFLPILAAVLQFFSYGIAIGTMSVIAALIINYLYISSILIKKA